MNKVHYSFIEYLVRHDRPVKVKEISLWLNVSPRTVKNYVREINSTENGAVIFSDYNGYTVDPEKAKLLLQERKKSGEVSRSYEERAIYINKKFLTYHTNKLDLYSIADELGYGEETIKADVVKMNKTYAAYGVSYQIKSDQIVINADEHSLRTLAKIILFDNINENLIDIYTIRQVFSDLDVDAIKDTLERILHQNDLYINDFGMINVVLHIAITIRRLINQQSLSDINLETKVSKDDALYSVSKQIAGQLSVDFGIPFNEEEIINIYLLIKANVSFDSLKGSEFQEYIGQELSDFTDHLINRINEKYYINLGNDNFRFPFAMHIKNLIFRLQNNQRNINPVSEIIKHSYPIIFDIAVFTAYLISEKYPYKIDDNELAYLALHIGGEIERQNFSQEKVNAVLLCPRYLNMAGRISSQLMINFANEIELLGICDNANELKKYHYELLFSVIELNNSNEEAITIILPPLNINNSFSQIQEAIAEIKEKRRLKILKTDFSSFFSRETFLINNGEYKDPASILKKCSDVMLEAGFVNEGFYKQVMEREAASTTAFPNIAIPHSLKLDAIKTSVCVMICPKGVEWGDFNIRIVLMVAVNKVDARRFGELYQALISMFDNDKAIVELIRIRTYEEFERFVRNRL
ncbi:MAG: PRD domain-containing protein [Erysipelotrichaceae bacterium]|nr:PRD domain-containing protein [Erysipelotrichaceae bacterium]